MISGDFFKDELPKAEVITMGNILHDHNEQKKKRLIKAAYDALPENGAFAAIESFIDDERKTNTAGLLTSLSMRVETGDGYNFTFADFQKMCREVGFSSFELMPLTEVIQAAVAYKGSKKQ